MLSLLVWESPKLWPLVAAAGAALTLLILWLYPAQVRGAGWGRWFPPLLRWVAVATLLLSALKPVILQPKTAEQWGAVLVLVDCSKSMSVTDTGRTPAEQVALAGALGRLPPGARTDVTASLPADPGRLGLRLREVSGAKSDLEYARVSGRGAVEKRTRLDEAVARYEQTASEFARRAAAAPEGSKLRQRLKELGEPPPAVVTDAWLDDARRRIEAVQTAAREFQSEADEKLYKNNAAVRSACGVVSRLSRVELAREMLARPGSGLVAKLGGNVPIIGLAVGHDLAPIALTHNGKPAQIPDIQADAAESDLSGAVSAALNRFSRRPIRAVVLVSDGRQVGGRAGITSSLRPSGVPVFTVGVASQQVPDVSIAGVSLPDAGIFAGETIEGTAEVTDDGAAGPPAELHVQGPSGERVEKLLPHVRSDRREHGRDWLARFSVGIDPGNSRPARRLVFSVPLASGETTAANNRVERWIKVSSDKLKVAVCTAAPTWDFQYLRSALSRRAWVRLESRVLDPEHPRLDLTPEQILDQDVLVLDDVPVDALDVNQWDAVHRLMTGRGGSVILVAGTSFPIDDYARQPIARSLLPFHDARPTWKEWPGEQPAFHFVPTPLGGRALPGSARDRSAGVRTWQELPGVFRYFAPPRDHLYPGVKTLLQEADSGAPVLTERRIGSGEAFFLGVNETWRWRLKSRGAEADRFWLQLVRHAAGEPYAASRGPLALDVDRVAARPGEPIHIRARTRGARTPAEAARGCPVQVLREGKLVSTRELPATGGGRFDGQIADLPEGDYQLRLAGVASDGTQVSVEVPLHIASSDEEEMRDVSGDAAWLGRLARSSGGEYLPIEQADRLADRLNVLRDTESQFVRRPLWNSPVLFGFVLACLAGEWALRKRLGLA